MEPRFVADAMLGRLARWLRALGYDTLYARDAPDARLLGIALLEGRRLLTRDVRLARRARDVGLLVRSEDLDTQLTEVLASCGPERPVPLSRCFECNAVLVPRTPADVRDRVPPYTYRTHAAFVDCPGCGRVFWAGSHGPGIQRRLDLHRRGPGLGTGLTSSPAVVESEGTDD